MVNLSTHLVPVTCDTQPVQSLGFEYAILLFLNEYNGRVWSCPQSQMASRSSTVTGQPDRTSCTWNSITKAIFSKWVLKIGHEPAFL